ncbi:hypothetical protein TNCV_843961 [Trichonephila clavipes]|nr:hypothetical protein TNCV_843961 [Trichonephila clavipes]
MMRTCSRNLILPGTPKPNRHSRNLLHAAQSYDMDAVNFLHHENSPTWAGVEPATFGAEGRQQTNYATQMAFIQYCNLYELLILIRLQISD